ncbi:FGGY family carbohydrate kinase [Microbacterium sediminis]|uniref:Xylulose kinase n=1 Tax=Microbacterium sediminis TaxID=904291 RepID=A0A1B9NAP1_9MICO|nr:FGGY family carbohydrate kinase [Microbacterium sediminis]OCG73604.1 xylulose kinase [Microbacterium sediminis]QBR73282.1 xylulose kinase [Microbacterium sediminis]
MTLVAGIDSSTQSCKVVIRDLDTGAIVRTGRASHPDGTEVDPAFWWEAMTAAIAEAGGLGDVAAVAIGGQQHGMVALDAEGRVIRPALLWNDTRSAAAASVLTDEVGAAEYVRRTGLVPVASFTATKLRWLADAEPAGAARIAAVALPHDWLTWRLRGYGPETELGPVLEELVTDRSEASGTAYFDPVSGAYDRELLSLALRRDASDVVLPRVLPPDGWVEGPGGLRVAAGAGDNAAAALGLGAATGDVVVSIGTSGTVTAVTDVPIRDETGTVAGFADAAGGFLPIVTTINAARVLDATASLLGVDHAEFARLALAASPGADGLVLQPWFEGERTPNRPDATATLFGMTLASTTRENLARAAIEGVLCGLAEGLDAVLSLGVQAERVLLIGGAAQSEAVATIATQVFDVPVARPEPGEYVALGAAAQAAWALTGQRPAWPVALLAEPVGDPRPVIREQYAARREQA